jgi:predicted nucleotidyltransferase
MMRGGKLVGSLLKELEEISKKARSDEDVLAIILFGSYARN